MFKNLIILCLATAISGIAGASELHVNENAPDVYEVKKGDTLWDIAGIYLDKPWHWPALWQQNPSISNPDRIYPGDKLKLNWQGGKPILSYIPFSGRSNEPAVNGVSGQISRQHLTYDSLIPFIEFELAPRVLGTSDGWNYISSRTPFFVDLSLELTDWFVYRPVTEFERDLAEGKERMLSLKKVGEAKLVRALEEISELKLVKQNQEIRPNDILLPATGAKTGEVFHPQSAPSEITASMIGHLYGSNYVGLRQIVVIDRGENDGLKEGHTLSIIEAGTALKGSKGAVRYESNTDDAFGREFMELPSQVVGNVLVIKSYPYFSLAMVVSARAPLKADMPLIAAEG